MSHVAATRFSYSAPFRRPSGKPLQGRLAVAAPKAFFRSHLSVLGRCIPYGTRSDGTMAVSDHHGRSSLTFATAYSF